MIGLTIIWTQPTPPLRIFLFLLAVRHIAQTLITMRIKKGGQKTDIAGTAMLAACYIIVMVITIFELKELSYPDFRFTAGLIIMESFVIMRMNALLKLGEFFSYEIRIAGDHELIREGIYGIIRHPLHLAFWGEVTGMAIMGNNPFGYLVSAILFIVILYRNMVEDEILEDKFGEEFIIYKNQVPSMDFILGLWKRYSGGSPAKAGILTNKGDRKAAGIGGDEIEGGRNAADIGEDEIDDSSDVSGSNNEDR